MSESFYYIWALLPLALFAVSGYAAWKRVFKMQGREYPKDYVVQAIFCGVLFIVAILLDQYLAMPFVDLIPYESIDGRIIRWLVYPLVLVGAAGIQHLFDKKREKREREEMRERQLKYTQKGY